MKKTKAQTKKRTTTGTRSASDTVESSGQKRVRTDNNDSSANKQAVHVSTRSSPRKKTLSAKVLESAAAAAQHKKVPVLVTKGKANNAKATESTTNFLASRGLVVGTKKSAKPAAGSNATAVATLKSKNSTTESEEEEAEQVNIDEDDVSVSSPHSESEEEDLEIDDDEEEDGDDKKPAAVRKGKVIVPTKKKVTRVVPSDAPPPKLSVFVNQQGTLVPVARRPEMFKEDAPLDEDVWTRLKHKKEIDDKKKEIQKFVRGTTLRNFLFFRNNKDADAIVGMCLHDLGMRDPGPQGRLMRMHWWAAVRALIMSYTSSCRQVIIRDWQNKFLVAFLNDNTGKSLPSADFVLECFAILFKQGISKLNEEQVETIGWVVMKVLPIVTRYNWNPFGVDSPTGQRVAGKFFCRKIGPSDLAAVLWLVKHYNYLKEDLQAVKKEDEHDADDHNDEDEENDDQQVTKKANKKTKRAYKTKVETKKAAHDYAYYRSEITMLYQGKRVDDEGEKKGAEAKEARDKDILVLMDQFIAASRVAIDIADDEEEVGVSVGLDNSNMFEEGYDGSAWMEFE